MNAVEIEEAVSALAAEPFDRAEFPFAFLAAFGNKETTLKRLRAGATNASDVAGGVLQRGNIHIATCARGEVDATISALRASTKTEAAKAKFILATDGETLQAEELGSDEAPIVCAYTDFPDHFGFFLPLAGITTVKQIRESSFDIKATGRLNRLYVELLKDNKEWDTDQRRPDMNHFMARLIFCFFAEDTDIFHGEGLFTKTVEQMSERDSSNTHEVIEQIFKAMDCKTADREARNTPRYANQFPYVNGQLFSGSTEVPRFSKIARSYLINIGNLDWKKINPDIFGSMIQAVADDEERGALGMHYTSVPNILKVLNPLFLDDLREKLEDAGDNARKLLNLRNRIAKIRVFDPACGSGNFLVIAYKEMRAIEAEINRRRGEPDRRTELPLTNFRGIELRDFPAEVARLALIIAEYQCDVLYRGQKEALAEFLPLNAENWITCGNALRLDWLSICPPTGTVVKMRGDDLFQTPLNQSEIDFENAGGETYICGNPPFSGTRKQTPEQKSDIEYVFSRYNGNWKNVDYVGGWFIKAAEYYSKNPARFAFVSTNSFCQGQQIPLTWNLLNSLGFLIRFAFPSFKWSNLASNKAGVTVVITGLDKDEGGRRAIFTDEERRDVTHINPYLNSENVEIVKPAYKPQFHNIGMILGVYYSKSAGLICSKDQVQEMIKSGVPANLFRKFLGSDEFIKGNTRYCLWIPDKRRSEAEAHKIVKRRIESVKFDRLQTKDVAVNKLAEKPHQFREYRGYEDFKIFVPIISSESREYFPAGVASAQIIPTNKAFYIPDAPLWALSVIVSKLHLAWIGTVCGRLEMRYSYSSTLGWNTFPLPKLTEQNKADLTACAESILLAREAHFPATIADLYDPEAMPENLRCAHEKNDEVLERIYIGRRFKNDTERLEKLFELYTRMTKKGAA